MSMGMELSETELNKRVKTIGNVQMKEEERMFLALDKKFRIQNEDWKKEEILLDVEDIIHNERKEEEENNRLRGKIIQMVERADRDRKDNLTEKERREMKDISRRKDIVIQAADKGGAIVIMEKDWYKDKIKEQITVEYEIIGKKGTS